MDAEKFNKFHKKARFRSLATTGALLAGGSSLLAPQLGMSSGRAVLRAYPAPAVALGLGSVVVSYQFWNYVVGFRRNEYNELLLSRYIRMTRNA